MEKLHASHDRFLVDTLASRLRGEGIEHLVKDESSSSLGEVPPIISRKHVWIVNVDDLPRAGAILGELESQREAPSEGSWTCSECNEVLESQFTSCWQCGHERIGHGGK